MKWFDSLFRSKKKHTKLGSDEHISQNQNHASHRDIGKKAKTISLSKNIFGPEHVSRISGRERIDLFVERWVLMLGAMTRKQWSMVGFLIFLSFIVYGVGFLLRTERHIQTIVDTPGILVSREGSLLMRNLFEDYQIIGLIANNPLYPIEPLASYGEILRAGRGVSNSINRLLDLESDVALWRTQSQAVSVLPLLGRILKTLESIQSDVHDIQSQLIHITQNDNPAGLSDIVHHLDQFLKHKDIWYTILGQEKPTRILLLNQNSDELRAGGGFPGTAFLVEFDGGRMTHFSFQDIYALDWHLKGYRPSPEGINQFKSLDYPGKPVEFEIRDANYFPLFSESARQLSKLMIEAGYGPVDLVVGVNQKLLEDIMRLVEPLNLPGVPVAIDHYNAFLVVSMLVEGKKTLKDTPKSTVKELGSLIFQSLQREGKMSSALSVLITHVFQGEVVAGSARPDIQEALDDVGIFDRWKKAEDDFIYPLFTSISRNKSDRLMERTFTIDHTSACDRVVTLTQKHWYDLTEKTRVTRLAHELGLDEKISLLLPVQGGGDNIQYLRFILPPGTQMIPEKGSRFSLLENNVSYATIHGYETTKPGTTSALTIRYRLAGEYCTERTEFFKQPGLRNTRILIKKNGQTFYQKFYE